MAQEIKRVRNATDTATVTTVEINSVTATTLLSANPRRMYARVYLDPTSDNIAYVREYPSATDNDKHGDVLVRDTVSNNSIFKGSYSTMPDNVFTGEISAISESGTFNLYVIEG